MSDTVTIDVLGERFAKFANGIDWSGMLRVASMDVQSEWSSDPQYRGPTYWREHGPQWPAKRFRQPTHANYNPGVRDNAPNGGHWRASSERLQTKWGQEQRGDAAWAVGNASSYGPWVLSQANRSKRMAHWVSDQQAYDRAEPRIQKAVLDKLVEAGVKAGGVPI